MESDVLFRDFEGSLETDDYAVFENIGAYSVVFKPPFIRTAPPIIVFDSKTKQWEAVRRAETVQDMNLPV